MSARRVETPFNYTACGDALKLVLEALQAAPMASEVTVSIENSVGTTVVMTVTRKLPEL